MTAGKVSNGLIGHINGSQMFLFFLQFLCFHMKARETRLSWSIISLEQIKQTFKKWQNVRKNIFEI